jgi:hypothetical protein
MWRVPASGGSPVRVTSDPPVDRAYITPYFLEDGKRFLYSDVSTVDATDARLMVGSLDGGLPRLLLGSATDARLLPSGQLVFMSLGTLMTADFDQRTATITGAPTAVMNGVMHSALRYRAASLNTGAGMYAVSRQGTLAVIRGDLAGAGQRAPLVWLTKDGRTAAAEPPSSGPEGVRNYLRISPDGSRVAATVITARQREVWILDFTRQVWTPCSDCQSAIVKCWAPDGAALLLGDFQDSLVAHSLTGFPPNRVVLREPGRIVSPALWLRDGTIVYTSAAVSEVTTPTQDIKVLEPGATVGRTLVQGSSASPDLSPNGRWLAYELRPSEPQPSIVVQPFPGPQAVTYVATGINPSWSPDGKTLYYISVPSRFMYAVDVRTDGATFSAGSPRQLLARTMGGCLPTRCYDVSPDGSGFLTSTTMADLKHESVTRIDVIVNWMSTLPK